MKSEHGAAATQASTQSRAPSRGKATIQAVLGLLSQTAVSSVQALVMVPVNLRQLGAKLLGAWSSSGDLLVWAQNFDLGLPNQVVQRIGAAHARQDARDAGAWFGTGFAVLSAVSILVAAITTVIAVLLPSWFPTLEPGQQAALRLAFAVGGVATAIGLLNNAVVAVGRGIQETGLLYAFQVLGSLAGFVVSLVLVLTGYGVMGLAIGMSARSAVVWIGSFIFYFRVMPLEIRRSLRIDRAVLDELKHSTPVMTASGLAYAALMQTDLLAVGLILGPRMATVMLASRRLIDLVRSLGDSITFSAYGSFSHLVASAEARRAVGVYSELLAFRISLGVAGATAFLACNGSFVSRWTNPSVYGGQYLTLVLAIQSVTTGWSFMANYLYRASGPIVRGCGYMIVEAVCRIALVFSLTAVVGITGPPLAALLTSIAAGIYNHRALLNELSTPKTERPEFLKLTLVCVVMLSIAEVGGLRSHLHSWLSIVAAGALWFGAAMFVLAVSDQRTRSVLSRGLARRRLNSATV